MAEFRELTDKLRFPEGPVAMSDGSVLVVEIKSGTIARVAPDGTVSVVAETGGGPNGAAIGPDGKLYVCNNGGFEWHRTSAGMDAPGYQSASYVGGSIQRVDLDSGAVEDLYTHCGGYRLRGPNDLVFDAQGGFYFTDHGKTRPREMDRGGLYYARADGTSIHVVVHPLDHPNGVGLSPDGDRLYVAETITGRVWAWDVEGPGVVKRGRGYGPGTLLCSLPGYQLLDSMAIDSEGSVCVATLFTGAVSVISPEGHLRMQVPVPIHDVFVTNICFGGPDLRTAYITSSGYGRLYATEWHCAGSPLQFNA